MTYSAGIWGYPDPTTGHHRKRFMLATHPFFARFYGMHNRCYNQNNTKFKDYGGRGIVVCERWHSFDNFFEDMWETWRPELELERIDNDGPYGPGNCRWATRSQNLRNTRRTKLTAEQVAEIRRSSVSHKETARVYGVSPSHICRIRSGEKWREP